MVEGNLMAVGLNSKKGLNCELGGFSGKWGLNGRGGGVLMANRGQWKGDLMAGELYGKKGLNGE